MALYQDLISSIGNTPLLRVSRFSPSLELYVKLEAQNPGGSAKDRAALYMIRDAVQRGLLHEGGTIVEPTSGNTGIGLAWISAVLGFKLILTMPETMSRERRKLVSAYGAQVVLTSGKEGMAGAIAKAQEIASQQNAFMPLQFDNPANAQAHEETTGPEILRDMNNDVGALVATIGTGGTFTGCGRAIRRVCPDAKLIAVEPVESAVLSGKAPGAHGIQGIGAGFVPKVLDVSLMDQVIAVSTQEAYEAARRLAKTEGVLCGISSGAALCAALKAGISRTVAVLPDTGERYLSTDLF